MNIRFFSIILLLMLNCTIYSAGWPIKKIKTSQAVVALTFDDGPNIPNDQKLLDLFKKEGVKVTFFLLGSKVKKNPQLAKRMLKEGHEIGNHSYTHLLLPKKNAEEIKTEIVNTQKIIKKITGTDAKIFRAPYFKHNENVWKTLKELNLPSIKCSIDSKDWVKKETTESITDNVTLKTKAGDIILLHSGRKKTIAAMPEIIKRLKAKGFRFVTVSELLKLSK